LKKYQNLPKLGGFVWKYTIWQPWYRYACYDKHIYSDDSKNSLSLLCAAYNVQYGQIMHNFAVSQFSSFAQPRSKCLLLFLHSVSAKACVGRHVNFFAAATFLENFLNVFCRFLVSINIRAASWWSHN
jgi:hypothetical protein